jgi:hypothetical protein
VPVKLKKRPRKVPGEDGSPKAGSLSQAADGKE